MRSKVSRYILMFVLLTCATEYEASIYSAEHENGKLFVRRLLPEEATVRKRGGEDFYAWSDGKHWPKENGQVYGWEYAAMWRIEEEPAVKRKSDEFPRVLYACDRGTPASQIPKATHVTTGNRIQDRAAAHDQSGISVTTKTIGAAGWSSAVLFEFPELVALDGNRQ